MGSDKLIEKTPTEDALSLPADNPSPSPSARMAYGARLRMDILTTNYWLLPRRLCHFHSIVYTRRGTQVFDESKISSELILDRQHLLSVEMQPNYVKPIN